MASDFVENKVREIIAEQLGVGDDDITLDSSISSDLGADTLDSMELVMAFEEEFEVEIDDADAELFRTVQDVVDFLSHRTQ